MMVLDSVQLLAAVQRTLSSQVLPKLDDDFARVQIAATLKILEEISDRLEHGDPCEDLNRGITADVIDFANRVQSDKPDFSAALKQAVASVGDEGDVREENRRLVESLWSLATTTDPENRKELLNLLASRGIEASEKDARWICSEALLSLI